MGLEGGRGGLRRRRNVPKCDFFGPLLKKGKKSRQRIGKYGNGEKDKERQKKTQRKKGKKNENGRFVGKENRDMKSLKKINRGLEIRRGLRGTTAF